MMLLPIDGVIMNSSRLRGLSFITSRDGGSDASAIAAKVSMMRFTHSICVTVSGISVPITEPPSTSSSAVTLTTNWKYRKRWMFLYNERPHITAWTIERKESSRSVMSDASFATLVPEPNDSPTWAWFNAGASLVPSPVTATTSPRRCNISTSRCLSAGRARDITLRSPTISSASSSLRAANSAPVILSRTSYLAPRTSHLVPRTSRIPICLAISSAVADVSPVTIFTSMPALTHCLTASGTSWRSGSLMAQIACSSTPSPLSMAKASVRIPFSCHPRSVSFISSICSSSSFLSPLISKITSGAPLIYVMPSAVVDIYFSSVVKGWRCVMV